MKKSRVEKLAGIKCREKKRAFNVAKKAKTIKTVLNVAKVARKMRHLVAATFSTCDIQYDNSRWVIGGQKMVQPMKFIGDVRSA